MEKIKCTISLDKSVRDDAESFFDSVGLSFSAGIELALRTIIANGRADFTLLPGERYAPSAPRVEYAVIDLGSAD